MPDAPPPPTSETLTFRVEPAVKNALGELGSEERKPGGQLLRELVPERDERSRRLAFEPRLRQSREAATAACKPNSDEAAMLRWLDAILDTLAEGCK